MSNAPRVIGTLAVLGVTAYIAYRIYNAGYNKGQEDTSQKYEQKINIMKIQHDSKINEMQALIDQYKTEGIG